MSPYLTLEVRLVGMSTVLGFILMASYDFLRLFRFFVPHGRLWTGIEDFFYWCTTSCGFPSGRIIS